MDNLKQIEQLVDQYIDPNGDPGSVLAENHNAILKDVLSKLGKYTGVPYLAHRNLNDFTTGRMSWNNNPLNLTEGTITFAKLSADLNDLERILKSYISGDLIKFKDYNGRAVLLEFQSYSTGEDMLGNPLYNVVVKGFPENLNYLYQVNEKQIAVFDFIKTQVNIIDVPIPNFSQQFLDQLTF